MNFFCVYTKMVNKYSDFLNNFYIHLQKWLITFIKKKKKKKSFKKQNVKGTEIFQQKKNKKKDQSHQYQNKNF